MKIIAGKFKNHKLNTPKDIRPATSIVRDSIFNICQSIIEEANFLDLLAGSGAIGLEALSRGAIMATFIDKSNTSIRLIKENIKKLGLQNITKVLCLDILRALKTIEDVFDIVSIDPPFIIYKNNPSYIDEIFLLIKTKKLIHQNSVIFLEEPTYSQRDKNIEGYTLQKQRKYGSAYLLEYHLK